jgi:hypothetical protein
MTSHNTWGSMTTLHEFGGVSRWPWDLLELGLTQKWETMALRMLTTIDLLCFIICEDPRESKFIEITLG